MSNKRTDYPYVRAWGRMMGSRAYYINDQVELARESKAPASAIFQKDDETWETMEGSQMNDQTRHIVESHAQRYK